MAGRAHGGSSQVCGARDRKPCAIGHAQLRARLARLEGSTIGDSGDHGSGVSWCQPKSALGRSSLRRAGAAARQCRRRARVPRVLETIQAMARRYASTRPLASACCAARRAAGQVRLNSCRVGSEFIRSCGSSVRRSRAAGIRRGLLPPGSLGSARGGVCRVRHRLGSSRTALQAPLASARLPRRRQRSSAAAFRQGGLDASAKATLW